MEVEIANEAFATLKEVSDCMKNPQHEGFISFSEFSLHDLPEDCRRIAILNFIKELGDRVVRLSVTQPDGQMIYGSGVVYKVGKDYLILTNDHVVGSERDVKNCTVDFFYHEADFSGIERCHGNELLGNSISQDRSYFTFSPIPKSVENLEMFDYAPLVAHVTVKYEDLSVGNCTSYVFLKQQKTFMLLPRKSIKNYQSIITYFIAFHNPITGGIEHAKFIGIDRVEEKNIHIEITAVPVFVVDALSKSWSAPWPRGGETFTPAVIAHPHGAPKMISLGKMLSVELEDGGAVKKLYHTAPTCPGSSGALVLTIGGDASAFLGYASNRCLHCMGDKVDTFRGIPTETGNLNISVFNN